LFGGDAVIGVNDTDALPAGNGVKTLLSMAARSTPVFWRRSRRQAVAAEGNPPLGSHRGARGAGRDGLLVFAWWPRAD
jgi:hypothetical protein